jgi:hypothetical protein
LFLDPHITKVILPVALPLTLVVEWTVIPVKPLLE